MPRRGKRRSFDETAQSDEADFAMDVVKKATVGEPGATALVPVFAQPPMPPAMPTSLELQSMSQLLVEFKTMHTKMDATQKDVQALQGRMTQYDHDAASFGAEIRGSVQKLKEMDASRQEQQTGIEKALAMLLAKQGIDPKECFGQPGVGGEASGPVIE